MNTTFICDPTNLFRFSLACIIGQEAIVSNSERRIFSSSHVKVCVQPYYF